MAEDSKRYWRGLTFREIALFKGMMSRGMARDKAHSYFVRPGRVLSPATASELRSGKGGNDIPPATDAEVDKYIALREAEAVRVDAASGLPPLSPTRIREVLFEDQGNQLLPTFESVGIEYKSEVTTQRGMAKLARAIVGMANSRGGYVFVGIQDDRTLCGISGEDYDQRFVDKLSKITQSSFSPAVSWQSKHVDIGGTLIMAIWVPEAERKPILSTRDCTPEISAGQIFFRYAGRTEPIQSDDLQDLLRERDRMTEARLRAELADKS